MSLTETVTEDHEFSKNFLAELSGLATRLDPGQLDDVADRIAEVRRSSGRVFVLGIGGGAANAAHAVCDLRGLAGVEAYAPTDSVSGFSAAANDFGWKDAFRQWLVQSRLRATDLVLVFSVGGGSRLPPVSENLVEAMTYAKEQGAAVVAVVGPRGGEAAGLADICVRVPVTNPQLVTAHTEIFQAVVWHLLVTHPALSARTPHWESLSGR